ncbi:MAG: hypothetical protein Hens3KO_06210 [Henriciella sp.]
MNIRVPSSATIANCEDALIELQSRGGADIDLLLSTKPRGKELGAEMSWVQFVLTWAKSQSSLRLKTFADGPDDKQIADFTDRLIGLIASLISDSIQSELNGIDLTSVYKSAALKRLDLLQDKRPNLHSRGPTVEIVAADDFVKDKPASLYPRGGGGERVLGSRVYYKRAAPRLLQAVAPNENQLNIDEDLVRAFGSLLYEIFRNTEDHARVDVYGNAFKHSYRVVHASAAGIKPDHLANATAGYAPLDTYIKRFRPNPLKKQLSFINLSILDSGPGFAQTWTDTPLEELSLADELRATLDCFSSGTRKLRDEYGKGLDLVRQYLRQNNGFMRLRTGRQSLYYDSIHDQDLGQPIPMRSWLPEGQEHAGRTEGALLTVLLPFGGTH